MITVIKLGLQYYIHSVSCNYPGCPNVQHFEGKLFDKNELFNVVPAEIESELIRLGWLIIEPESANRALLLCPSHKAYLERFSDDVRKKVVDTIAQERNKYMASLIWSLQRCLC